MRIAVAMPAAQIIYSEYRRKPSDEGEIQTTLEISRHKLGSIRAAQAKASDLLNETGFSRLRSGLSTHLCGLSFESQGAFATRR